MNRQAWDDACAEIERLQDRLAVLKAEVDRLTQYAYTSMMAVRFSYEFEDDPACPDTVKENLDKLRENITAAWDRDLAAPPAEGEQ